MNWFVIKGSIKNNKEKDMFGYKFITDWMPFVIQVEAQTLYQANLAVVGTYGKANIIIDIDNSYVLLDDIDL